MAAAPQARTFLTARWLRLCLVTYAVPRDLLEARLPAGLELDLGAPGALAGAAYVSLVAFDFADTGVKGLRVPGLVNFPEINLRFYVRERGADRRGVMFIRELVPSRVTSLVAWLVYNEPYRRAAMRSEHRVSAGRIEIEHAWRFRGVAHRLRAEADAQVVTPREDSAEHFFKEHEWGYGVTRGGRTLRYRVEHPVWAVHPNPACDLAVDFGSLYGPEWAFLSAATPANVTVAEGSAVTVFHPC